MPKRFTVLAVNHSGYALTVILLGIAWDDEVFGIVPILAGGPLSFFGHTNFLLRSFPFVSGWWVGLFIVGFLFLPIVLLMSAHTFRPNLVGVILRSLGTAYWYLTGIGGGLARMM